MRRTVLSMIVGFATVAAVLAIAPQDAQAREGYRGYSGRGYGYDGGYRPYRSYYRPYRSYGTYQYPGYRSYEYIPPTYGPSPYGYPGMIGPRPVQINPGIIYPYYRF